MQKTTFHHFQIQTLNRVRHLLPMDLIMKKGGHRVDCIRNERKNSGTRKKKASRVRAKVRYFSADTTAIFKWWCESCLPRCARKEGSAEKKRGALKEKDELSPTEDAKKRRRRICSADGCTNQAVKEGVCIRHGAQVKLCSSEGCSNKSLKGGVCKRHGAKVKRCSYEGCTNQAQNGGVCMKHGAKRKLCSKEGCTNQAQKGGVCYRHGAKKRYKRCSTEECRNEAKKGGVA